MELRKKTHKNFGTLTNDTIFSRSFCWIYARDYSYLDNSPGGSPALVGGLYNATYFANHPEERDKDGVLYCVILVNKKTNVRECLKIGIAVGKTWKDVLKRSRGFKGYDIRIQKIYHDTIYNCWKLEQALHKEFQKYQFKPTEKFGGHTECFHIKNEIILAIPSKK